MKKLSLLLFIVLSILAISANHDVHADEYHWSGAQTLTSVGGGVEVHEQVLVFGKGVFFYVPETGFNQYFLYAGIIWAPADFFNISFFTGYAGNFIANSDAGLVGITPELKLLNGDLSLSVDLEFYFNKDDPFKLYAFYDASYTFHDPFGIGLHVEQVDDEITWGPHFFFRHGPWKLTLSAFIDHFNGGYTLRITNGLWF
jgi:hypothetical protein